MDMVAMLEDLGSGIITLSARYRLRPTFALVGQIVECPPGQMMAPGNPANKPVPERRAPAGRHFVAKFEWANETRPTRAASDLPSHGRQRLGRKLRQTHGVPLRMDRAATRQSPRREVPLSAAPQMVDHLLP